MPRIAYERYTPRGEAAAMIRAADDIASDYARQGYDLTLRQLYYQFVARDLLPNSQRSYDRLGSVINKARLGGFIDWNHLTDRTRNLAGLTHWDDPAQIIRGAARGFRLDWWQDQPLRIEVWVEKEALAGVVARVANRWDVDYFSCRGYVSQSEMWSAAQRLGGYLDAGQRVLLLHLGDHDPSGIDMSRDIEDRLTGFITGDRSHLVEGDSFYPSEVLAQIEAEHGWDEPAFVVRRIALNMDQVEAYGPPPNPAKITDSRAQGYITRFGESSWELDALDPATLDALIDLHIQDEVDADALSRIQERQREQREVLTACTDRWAEVAAFLTAEDQS